MTQSYGSQWVTSYIAPYHFSFGILKSTEAAAHAICRYHVHNMAQGHLNMLSTLQELMIIIRKRIEKSAKIQSELEYQPIFLKKTVMIANNK